jgi:hypothetical protein
MSGSRPDLGKPPSQGHWGSGDKHNISTILNDRGMVCTSVGRLSIFRLILWISIKHSKLQGRVFFFFKSIYYTIRLNFHFLKNSFTAYEYIGFQFLKHDEYAQRICISNFQFYCFKKIYKNTT